MPVLGSRLDRRIPAVVDRESVEAVLTSVLAGLTRYDGDRFDDAATVFRQVALGADFPAFLTVPAYAQFLVERC